MKQNSFNMDEFIPNQDPEIEESLEEEENLEEEL